MEKRHDIVIVGAGVSGVSMALSLLSMGIKAKVISREHPFRDSQNPQFSSQFPAASIIPHTVSHPEVNSIFHNSQFVFKQFHDSGIAEVNKHEHFELFTKTGTGPSYRDQLENYREFEQLEWYPRHPDIRVSSGWKFDCYFADWSRYFPFLVQSLEKQGVEFETKDIDLNALQDLPYSIIINCTGLGSSVLASEPVQAHVIRGHLLQVRDAPLLTNKAGQTVSYNFNPGVEFYANQRGDSQDVYCYPRSDGWVFGGSRQHGTLSAEHEWESLDGDPDTFPEQIAKLNGEIIQYSFGIDSNQYTNRVQKSAYRYYRDEKYGLRIEAESIQDRLVLHNYGNGGAGVTLSWGTCYELLQLLNKNGLIPEISLHEFSEQLVSFLSADLPGS